jgi:hypothetical protein
MLLSTVHLKLPREKGVVANAFDLGGTTVDFVD